MDSMAAHSLEAFEELLRSLAERGGPGVADYPELRRVMVETSDQLARGRLERGALDEVMEGLGDVFSTETLQGWGWRKPRGYAGDYLFIDGLYTRRRSSRPELARWDDFLLVQAGARAVRNRLHYLHSLLDRGLSSGRPLRLLDLASGSGRDLAWYLQGHPGAELRVHGVDQDPEAVDFARGLTAGDPRASFERGNVVHYETEERYELCWSAGLFDYFDDELFVKVLRRMASFTAPGGEVVVGNFSPEDPSWWYMEILHWPIHRRSATRLRRLAAQAGFEDEQVEVRSEPEGVNLFLHVRIPEA